MMVALVNGTFKIMMWNKLKVGCAWSVPIILAADATPLQWIWLRMISSQCSRMITGRSRQRPAQR